MPEKTWGEWIIRYLQFTVWTWVVKCATSLFNSFFSNVVKQVARFCCPSVSLRAPSKSQNWQIGPLFWQQNGHFRELKFFYSFASDLRRVWSGWSVLIVEFFLRTWELVWPGRPWQALYDFYSIGAKGISFKILPDFSVMHLDHYTFLGKSPPTPPLSQNFALS